MQGAKQVHLLLPHVIDSAISRGRAKLTNSHLGGPHTSANADDSMALTSAPIQLKARGAINQALEKQGKVLYKENAVEVDCAP